MYNADLNKWFKTKNPKYKQKRGSQKKVVKNNKLFKTIYNP